MYRDIVRILLQRIRIWLTSIRNDRRMHLFNFPQFLSFKFPNTRCYIFAFPASSLRFCKLFDSLILVFNFQFCNFSNFNLPISPINFSNFRFSSFNFRRCVFQTSNIQFFKFPSQQKFSLQANNHRKVVRCFTMEKFVTVLFHHGENIGKGQVLRIFELTVFLFERSTDSRRK